MGRTKRSRSDGAGRGGPGQDGKKRRWQDPSRVAGIPLGCRGILFSCITGKESYAGREAIEVVSSAYEELAPSKDDTTAADNATDISSLIANEVADLKDKKKQLFTAVNLGINSMTFIQFNKSDGPSPSDVAIHLCRKAKETQQNNTRLVTRLYPVDYTCTATMESMEEMAKKIAEEHFKVDAAQIEFAVEYEKRAADPRLDRMEIVNMFAKVVPQPPHKVQLTDPRKSILINIVKAVCGVSVVEDYRALGKYNIKKITGQTDDFDKLPPKEKKTEGEATEGKTEPAAEPATAE